MHGKHLLIVTAFSEAATGLVLLCLPGFAFSLLLGIDTPATEATLVGRIAGAALLAFGMACWSARRDEGRVSRRELLAAKLIYDTAAAALLVYAGLKLNMVGLALWPGVVLHAVLAAWCVICLASPHLWRTP